jgi:DNA-binding ferritin-like protein (Dps family)
MNQIMNEAENEAFRVPEAWRNIPEKLEIFTLKKIIKQQTHENHQLLNKILELDEKNALWKATMVKVMNGDVVEYINDNLFPVGDFTEDWEWTAKNRQQMILKIREMLGGGA